MRRFSFFIISLLWAAPAFALSCMPWDPARTYQEAEASEQRFVIALGSFFRTGEDVVLPRAGTEDDGLDLPNPYHYPAEFIGNLGSRVGFRTPADLEVTVHIGCAAHWCGAPPPNGQEVLAFLSVDDNRDYSLVVGACPFWLNTHPDEAALEQIIACMRGEACESEF